MVITISRTYGSGGRVMGKALAKKLGYKFYDAELVRMLSDETGINEALFGESDERLKKSYWGVDTEWKKNPEPLAASDRRYSSETNLFKLEAKMIRKLADEGNCIIMGRCADTILEGRDDVVRLYCYASHDNCLKRAMDVCGLDEKEIEKRIASIDKYRQLYYKHFTGKELSDARNYDLCIDTGSKSVDLLAEFVYLYMYTVKNNHSPEGLKIESI